MHGCKFDLTVGINMPELMTLGVQDHLGASARWPRSLDVGREQVHHERTRETSTPTPFIPARIFIPANSILFKIPAFTEGSMPQPTMAYFGDQSSHLL